MTQTSPSKPNYFAHPTCIIDDPCVIGDDTKIWHFSHIMANSQIGQRCNLGQNVVVSPRVKIGNYCKIQNNVSIYEGVILEDYVFCGPSMVFTNVKTPRCEFPRNTSNDYVTTLVKRGASIGANATIVCGVTLNECVFVAAGAVVTKDVPAYAMVAGCPAKIIGWMSAYGDVMDFSESDTFNDSQGHMYRKIGDTHVERLK